MIAVGPSRSLSLMDMEVIDWDVVILGAGVAGAAAAILASQQGLQTLLVESKGFPREKVCGGCLNLRSQASLDRLGVSSEIKSAGAVPIQSMRLQILATKAQWKVPTMVSIRRSTLDSILVDRAISTGSHFIDRTTGHVMATSHESNNKRGAVRLQKEGNSVCVSSKCILVASGLTRSSIRPDDHWPAKIESDSRIGVQCLIPERQAKCFADGQLHMLVGRHGYVGICKTDGDLLDIAAAIDPACIQSMGGIPEVIRTILSECGHDGIELPSKEHWMATPSLTRCSTRVSDQNTFLIGDAIGYVEPFTGEGMSWALASAEAVMPMVFEIASSGWSEGMEDRWNDWALRERIHKQRTCRWIASQIRWPRGAAWVLRACNWLPPLRASIIRRTSQ